LPIRWRLTLFIALAIGAILLVLGVALFFMLREVLLSTVEDTAERRAEDAARIIRSGQTLQADDVKELTLDGVFVIIRNGEGDVLTDYPDRTSEGENEDRVWKKALDNGHPASDKVEISGDGLDYIYAVPARAPQGRARVVEAGKSYKPTREEIREIGAILAAGIGVALLLSIAGAYLLAGTALRPVEAVTVTARRWGSGTSGSGCPLRTRKMRSDALPPP
jgi:two-component system, OmpR family, sensor kinase